MFLVALSMILTHSRELTREHRRAQQAAYLETRQHRVMKAVFRSVAGTIGLFALGLQYWLMTRYPDARSSLTTFTRFFSYFTILTNTLIVLSMFLPLIGRNGAAGQLLSKPSVRTAIVNYSVIVAIVYFLFLRNIGNDRDLELVADRLLHYVTPTMFVVDWLLFVAGGEIGWSTIGTSLILPTLYGLWTLVHGALTGWYPYPFFNVARIGYPRTLGNFALFIVLFVVTDLVLIFLDRLIRSFSQRRNPT